MYILEYAKNYSHIHSWFWTSILSMFIEILVFAQIILYFNNYGVYKVLVKSRFVIRSWCSNCWDFINCTLVVDNQYVVVHTPRYEMMILNMIVNNKKIATCIVLRQMPSQQHESARSITTRTFPKETNYKLNLPPNHFLGWGLHKLSHTLRIIRSNI